MKTKTQETSKQDKLDYLIERVEIKNTPFKAVRYDNKWLLTMGKYRLSSIDLESYDEVIKYLDENKWKIIGNMILILQENLNNK